VDRVQALVALHGRAERAAPHDVGGEVPVVAAGVALIDTGLKVGDQLGHRLGRVVVGVPGAERRAARGGFVSHLRVRLSP
jgi:hypothetical protein